MIITLSFIVGWSCLFVHHVRYILGKIKGDNDKLDKFLNKSNDLSERHTREACECVREAFLNLAKEKS